MNEPLFDKKLNEPEANLAFAAQATSECFQEKWMPVFRPETRHILVAEQIPPSPPQARDANEPQEDKQ